MDTRAPQASTSSLMYPPKLAEVVGSLLPSHPLLSALNNGAFAAFLSEMFFASMQDEEGEHQIIRTALTPPAPRGVHTPGPAELRFREPPACVSRTLLRLARAAGAERMVITLAERDGQLVISGLAREHFGDNEQASIRVDALKPGCLEIWASGERILEYVRGYVQKPPEDLLLAAGPVRQKLLGFASSSCAPRGYIECIAGVLRHMADHPHGGILVLSAEVDPAPSGHAMFALESDTYLWDLLEAMEGRHGVAAVSPIARESFRADVRRIIAEFGCMTALDGATILDRRLALCGFGVVLPVRSDVAVLEVVDAAGLVRRPFPLDQYGARHRAAATYADAHPGSLVFFASMSGDIGCVLRDDTSSTVLLWRFRSGDIRSAVS
jgi:hypothetical protein